MLYCNTGMRGLIRPAACSTCSCNHAVAPFPSCERRDRPVHRDGSKKRSSLRRGLVHWRPSMLGLITVAADPGRWTTLRSLSRGAAGVRHSSFSGEVTTRQFGACIAELPCIANAAHFSILQQVTACCTACSMRASCGMHAGLHLRAWWGLLRMWPSDSTHSVHWLCWRAGPHGSVCAGGNCVKTLLRVPSRAAPPSLSGAGVLQAAH